MRKSFAAAVLNNLLFAALNEERANSGGENHLPSGPRITNRWAALGDVNRQLTWESHE